MRKERTDEESGMHFCAECFLVDILQRKFGPEKASGNTSEFLQSS